MKRTARSGLLAAAMWAALSGTVGAAPVAAPPLPTSPDRWIGAPVSWESLRGRVVVVDVWTFG